MKKERGNIWFNCASKPKGFTFVKGNLLTYKYEIPVMMKDIIPYSWRRTLLDSINIKVKIEYRDGRMFVDKNYTSDNIHNELGSDLLFEYEDSCFMRDGRLFPFVSLIIIEGTDKEKYLHHKLVKNRREKIEKLKNKING